MKYLWLLFDVDNTLFDYSAAEAQALRRTFEECGVAYQHEYLERYRAYNRQVWQEYEHGEISTFDLRLKRFHLLFDEIGVRLDPQTFSPLYLRNLEQGTQLIDGAQEVLKALHLRYSIALVTNGFAETQRSRLERSAIRDCFDKVFISEEIGAAKPEKTFFEAVFRGIGNPPSHKVLMIGDNLSADIQGGMEYGMDTCWFNPKRETSTLTATYQITALRELLDIL